MRIQVDKAGEFGLVTDPSPQEIPPNAWTTMKNVRCEFAAVRNVWGYTAFDTPTDLATYLVGLDFSGTWYAVYPSTDAIYSWTGGTETDISRVAGYNGTSAWNGCVLGGVIILNNYSDCPQYWGGTGDCVDLIYSGSDTWDAYDGSDGEYRAKVIRSYRNFLFALGISEGGTEYPYMVHWSNPADPGAIPDSWDYADPNTLSGRFDLGDTAGYVVDALALNDVLVIYKEDSVWIGAYTGGQYQFNFSKLAEADGLGIYAQNCAVDIGGRHVVLGDGVLYMHNGSSVQNILKGRAAETLFDAIDPAYYQRTFLVHVARTTEVWVCYPPLGETVCTRAFVYNYAENSWSSRELPGLRFAATQVIAETELASWPTDASGGGWEDDLSASWDSRNYSPTSDTLVGVGAELWRFAEAGDFDGASPECLVERTGLRFGEGGQVSLVRAVYPRIVGSPVNIQVGSQMTLDGSVTWNTAQSFNPASDSKIDVLQPGVFHAIRFKTTHGGSWRLNGYELDIEVIGAY